MASDKNSIRIVLAVLLASSVVLNAGLCYIAYELSADNRPERLDELEAKIERGEIEVSRARYLSSISGMKRYAIASDQLVSGFQKLVALMAAANILVILIVTIWLWRTTGKLKPIAEE